MMRRTTNFALSLTLSLGAFGLAGLAAGNATADEGNPVVDPSQALVQFLDGTPKSCAARAGSMCFSAGDATTVAVESAPVAAATNSVPQAARFAPSAAIKTGPNDPIRWVLDAMAEVKGKAWTGNAVFLFFDNADPEAQANHETVAMYQGPIHSGKVVPLQLNLSREDGFRPGHSYHLRVAQLINGKEITISEGDFSLL